MLAECLDRIIFFGEHSLRRAVREYVAHYHAERNHQRLGNAITTPLPRPSTAVGRMRCRFGPLCLPPTCADEYSRIVPRQNSIRLENDGFALGTHYRQSGSVTSWTTLPHPFIVVCAGARIARQSATCRLSVQARRAAHTRGSHAAARCSVRRTIGRGPGCILAETTVAGVQNSHPPGSMDLRQRPGALAPGWTLPVFG